MEGKEDRPRAADSKGHDLACGGLYEKTMA
jgi:hypothetical protein